MISSNDQELITINLNGQDVQVPNGINAIEAAAIHGKEIPHYCYHSHLSVAGNCRMCLIEMGTPMRDRASGEPILEEDGSAKIGWVPKPVIGCATNVSAGMHLRTESDKVKGCQEGIMEFLLVNHPLDCPICDQAGECRLQEFATDYGRGYSRYIERKNVKPKRTRLGPRVTLDDERCILCSRCIRFSQEVAKDDVLGFVDRGSFSTLTCFPGKELANNYSLNTVDICPVGALTSTDFRFKMRVWFLKETPSICTESSAGCNITVSSREGVIHRITPRRNDLVNDSWMTDTGRTLYKSVKSDDRLLQFSINGEPSTSSNALDRAGELLKGRKLGVVASAKSTVEELFLIKQFTDSTEAKVFLRGHFGQDDGILLSADRTPNLRGALATQLTSQYPADHLNDLTQAVEQGDVDALLVCSEDLLSSGVSTEVLENVPIVFLGTHENETSKIAQVVLPSLSVFEKSGSFINRSFVLQSFKQAVPGPAGILADAQLVAELHHRIVGGEKPSTVPAELWDAISASTESVFSGISHRELQKNSIQLDGSAWSGLPFVEQVALHFQPATAEVSA
jgi:NADH-quinone oxidoreductase subunit G